MYSYVGHVVALVTSTTCVEDIGLLDSQALAAVHAGEFLVKFGVRMRLEELVDLRLTLFE